MPELSKIHDIRELLKGGRPKDECGNEAAQSIKYARDIASIYLSEKAKRKELEAAEERIRAVINAMNDAMAATNGRFDVLESNESFRKLFMAAGEHAGRVNATQLLGDTFTRAVNSLQTDVEQSAVFDYLHEASGKSFNVRVSKLGDGRYVFVFHDVTAEKRVKGMRDEFLGILSHELRTPLNGVLGFAQILLSEEWKLDAEQVDCIRMIEASGRRMFKTVDELLSYADLVADAQFDQSRDIDLDSMIAGVVDEMLPAAEDRNVRLVHEAWGSQVRIYGKPKLIEELLRHLLWNCILFGNSGGEARASVKPKRFGATVYVSDDGVGVPPHEQEKVFDPFYQVQEYLSRNREGLGLGLTLARRIARMHKGDVVLKSDGKSGTTAVIELADLMR